MSDPVVIVGGGPAGLLLAAELRLGGVETVLLERNAEPPDGVSEGMTVHGRTLELLRHRGIEDRIEPELLLRWPRTPFSLMWLDMTGVPDQDFTFMYPQWRVERLLEARARELGADVRRGHRVTAVAPDAGGVTVSVTGGGEEYTLRAAYLVGADGPDSLVRQAAGIGYETIGRGYYGVFGDMEPAEDADRTFDSGVFPNGMFGAVPISATLLRLMTIEFDVPRPPDEEPVTEQELVERITHITGRRPRLGTIRWVSRYGRPTQLAERYRAGRVLLVGDAAHHLFISGTHGLNTGLHDAANLGWKLAATVNGWAPEGLLDTYEAERRPVGLRMCKHATAVMALAHPVDQIGPLREFVSQLIAFDSVSKHLLRMTTEVRYPIGAGDDPLAGRQVPEFTPVGASPGAPLAAARGLLLDLSDGAADLSGAAGWADRVEVVAAKAAADTGAPVVLVRPDGHVAYSGTAGAGLQDALRTWFGEPGTV
ncbi:FAD-dependent monooxygenase [Streptomyces sp. NPDC020983]|uniref:FAD-dependent monooxygenase n=1 Tax=Streptomyces sp. NPDC020983 TaxID=3365106 RepID=UPI0037974B34